MTVLPVVPERADWMSQHTADRKGVGHNKNDFKMSSRWARRIIYTKDTFMVLMC